MISRITFWRVALALGLILVAVAGVLAAPADISLHTSVTLPVDI